MGVGASVMLAHNFVQPVGNAGAVLLFGLCAGWGIEVEKRWVVNKVRRAIESFLKPA